MPVRSKNRHGVPGICKQCSETSPVETPRPSVVEEDDLPPDGEWIGEADPVSSVR